MIVLYSKSRVESHEEIMCSAFQQSVRGGLARVAFVSFESKHVNENMFMNPRENHTSALFRFLRTLSSLFFFSRITSSLVCYCSLGFERRFFTVTYVCILRMTSGDVSPTKLIVRILGF